MTARHLVLATLLSASGIGAASAENAPTTHSDAAAIEHAIAHEGWSSAALLDLGNAYEAAGQHGRAILAFERARLIHPRDATIAASLARARDAAGITAPKRSWVARSLGTLTADEWTWIALGAGSLACLGLVAFAWSRSRRAIVVLFGGAAVTLATGVAAVAVAPPADRAIVLADTTAHIAPASGSETAFTPAGGETVEIVKRHGAFVLVRDDERSGWLPETAIERIVDRMPRG
ncbi:MAG: hypothetical protein AB7T06_39970 [Kofleriaceae bacterium]